MERELLFDFLEAKYRQYNRPEFIESDPVSIPHLFNQKEDREIAGFLAASIAWGKRSVILRNAKKLLEHMDYSPHAFIVGFTAHDLDGFAKFVHRTFNGEDCIYFMKALQNIYRFHGGLEAAFFSETNDVKQALFNFRKVFFELPHLHRVEKHVANPARNASAKRLNMFLRWMVRKDNLGVDFGIWNTIQPGQLFCPLDVHSGNVARKLGLLNRKQDDWKAVEELTLSLRKFDSNDPVKYDFSLFGLGVFEGF